MKYVRDRPKLSIDVTNVGVAQARPTMKQFEGIIQLFKLRYL